MQKENGSVVVLSLKQKNLNIFKQILEKGETATYLYCGFFKSCFHAVSMLM
jgi:hypothetical protein